jgi:thiol-disulfide isomerase/thioredoxin
MRAPVDTILAPPFPPRLEWINSPPQSPLKRGRPMLVEFWDFCRPNSLRTLPYLQAWDERYGGDGLRTIGVHCPGFQPSHDADAVRAAVARLGIRHAVLLDPDFEVWQEYENEGWPARYLFDGRARLVEYHRGEGGYAETERAIQELVGVEREPLAPLRPEDVPGAVLVRQSEDRPGAYSGPYAAGGAWAVLDGSGTVRVRAGAHATARELRVEHPGAYALVEHERHTEARLELELDGGVRCHATCFTPGVA